MGLTRVKTTYNEEGHYGSTIQMTLYCHHNHSCDCITFYHENGVVVHAAFCEWDSGNDLWDAMQRLWYPFKYEWGGELKDKVEYYGKDPWEID